MSACLVLFADCERLNELEILVTFFTEFNLLLFCNLLPVNTLTTVDHSLNVMYNRCRPMYIIIVYITRCGAQHSVRAALRLRTSIANISGTEQDIDNRKTALLT